MMIRLKGPEVLLKYPLMKGKLEIVYIYLGFIYVLSLTFVLIEALSTQRVQNKQKTISLKFSHHMAAHTHRWTSQGRINRSV